MGYHIENLKIERFRGLRDLELPDFGRINLLVGPNNSGKTSVLEAIAAYCHPFDPLEWLNTAVRRGVSSYGDFLFQSLRWLFPLTPTPNSEMSHQKIEMQAQGEFQVRSVCAAYQEIRGIPDATDLQRIKSRHSHYSESADEPEVYQGVEFEVAVTLASSEFPYTYSVDNLHKKFTFWEGDFIREAREDEGIPYLDTTIITPISHRTEFVVDEFTKVTLRNEGSHVLDLVQMFAPAVEGLQILTPDGSSGLFVSHRDLGIVPLHIFGDGMRRVVMMALALPGARDGVLLIDEIETAIHISVLAEVLGWLGRACKEYNVQLFATTHSQEALDALLNVKDTTQESPVVFRLGVDGSPAKRFSGDVLYRLLRERGLDIR